MDKITKLSDPLPKVHQCGCGSQAFHLCADGRVVCLQCRYIITTLTCSTAPKPPAEWMAEAAREIRAAYVAFSVGAGAQPMYDHIERIIAKHLQHAPKVPA